MLLERFGLHQCQGNCVQPCQLSLIKGRKERGVQTVGFRHVTVHTFWWEEIGTWTGSPVFQHAGHCPQAKYEPTYSSLGGLSSEHSSWLPAAPEASNAFRRDSTMPARWSCPCCGLQDLSCALAQEETNAHHGIPSGRGCLTNEGQCSPDAQAMQRQATVRFQAPRCENHVRELRTFFTVVLEPNIHTFSVLSETLPDFFKSKLC